MPQRATIHRDATTMQQEKRPKHQTSNECRSSRRQDHTGRQRMNRGAICRRWRPASCAGVPKKAAAHSTVILASVLIGATILIAQSAGANQLVSMPYHYQSQQQQQLQQQQQNNRHGENGGNNLVAAASSSSAVSAPLFKDLSGPTSGKIQTLDVICGKHFMTVRAEFSGPFYGIVFSKGTYGQDNCIYVKPNSGLTHAAFNVYYDQCGTKPELAKKFYENTIVIQYGSDIIEAYDEAKRLRCEWFEAYEKPATFKPAIPVADLEVVEMNFQGDDIDCWMEIQEGTGPTSREVSKIVPVGQPMTIVVAINDYNGQFDMRVKSCVAHDGQQQPIALTDEFGCVLRPKMLTAFQKVRNPGGIHKRATILSYSRFLAFKFPDSTTVMIQCTVEVCRHGCADACQKIPSIAATTLQPELSLSAKWPAASNQPSIGDMTTINRALNGPHDDSLAVVPNLPTPEASQPASGDDMSGSESHHQPAVVPGSVGPAVIASANLEPQRQPQHHHYHHHHHHHHQTRADGRIPQYSKPNYRRQQPMQLHGARLPSSTTGVPQQNFPETTVSVASEPQSSGGDRAQSSSSAQPNTVSESTVTTVAANEAVSVSGEESSSDQLQDSAATQAQNKSQQEAQAEASNDNKHAELPQESSQSPTVTAADQPAIPDSKVVEVSQSKPAENTASAQQEVAAGQQQSQASSGQLGQDSSARPEESSSSSGSIDKQGDVMSAEASEIKPSVQGDDEQQQQVKQREDSSQSSSSLKTVEVEIPANEDPVRAFMAQNGNTPDSNQNAFSSVRLSSSSGDMSGSPASYDSVMFENSRYQDQANGANNKDSLTGIIQPRENSNRPARDKQAEEEPMNFEASAASHLIGGSGKMRFGARSQPQQHAQTSAVAATGPVSAGEPEKQQEQQSALNHHSSGSSSGLTETSGGKTTSESGAVETNPDRILLDRSDESPLSDASSQAVANSEPAKIAADSSSSSASMDESSQAASLFGSSSANKIMPVVGTDELATGPVQIEDRIGVPAPASVQHESLEEALTRLQQQIPQSAALVSSSQSSNKQEVPSQRPDETAAQSQPTATGSQSSSVESASGQSDALDRADRDRLTRKDQRPAQKTDSTLNQPHPNVAGQAKVIPEPAAGSTQRGQLQTQASNTEGVYVPNGPGASSMPSSQQKQFQSPPSGGLQVAQQLPQQQFSQPPLLVQQQPLDMKQQQAQAVAQITNVPVGIGFAQSQIPAIQQLQLQLAQQYQQQKQQQQQQQQSTTTTTPKPTRSRFNLLSPQAAFQAVASRLLPKSKDQAQRLPQIDQQKLTGAMQYTAEQQQQQKLFGQQVANYMIQSQQQQQNAFPIGLSAPVNQAAPVNQPQTHLKIPGLFSRLTSSLHSQHGQQQPVTRTRRSALMPNADNKGEVGVKRTFIVVTGMDLAFSPSLNDSELPEILNGHRAGGQSVMARRVSQGNDEIIYGVCMPIVSLTFVLTCAFWLIVFLLSFCIYLFIKSRRQQSRAVKLRRAGSNEQCLAICQDNDCSSQSTLTM